MSALLRPASFLLLGFALLGTLHARAEEPEDDPPSPAEAAAAVRDAHAAGNEKALAKLAAQYFPDPWLTCHVLLLDGALDAADAFARQVPKGFRGGLVEEVAAWRAEPEAAGATASFARSIQASASGAYDDAIAALDGATPRRGLTKVRVAFRRASLLTWKHEEAAPVVAAFAAAYELAKATRWPDMRTRAAHWTGVYARRDLDWELASSWFQTALDSARSSSPPEIVQQLLRDLGQAQRTLGRTAEARRSLEEAVAVSRKAELAFALAQNLYFLSEIRIDLGRNAEGAKAAEESTRIFRALDRTDGVIGAQLALGRALREMGRLREARAPLEAAQTAAEKLGMSQQLGIARRMLGSVALREGRYAAALELLTDALRIARAVTDKADAAAALHGMGEIHMILGSHEQALAALEEAIRLKTELKRVDAAVSLWLAAHVQRGLGNLDAAWIMNEEALRYHRAAGDRRAISTALTLQAELLRLRQKPADARKALEEALAHARALGDGELEAWTLWALGRVVFAAGHTVEARAALAAAWTWFEKHDDLHGRIHVDYVRARVLLQDGDPAAAIAAIDRARAGLGTLLEGLTDWHAVNFGDAHRSLTWNGLQAAAALGDVDAAFRMIEGGRAGALLQALGGRGAVLTRVMPQDLRAVEQRARVAEQRALQELRLAIARGDGAGAEAARARAAAARVEIDAAIARMQREAPQAADVAYSKPISLTAFASTLRPDEAYVALDLIQGQGFAVIVTRKDARLLELPGESALRAALERLRFDVPGVLDQKHLDAVRTHLVKPLALPAGTKRILLSPGPSLAAFPFAVLFPEREVVHVPSATTWTLLGRDGRRKGTGVLAAGDPVHPEGATLGGVKLVPLPHARAEAEAVGDVVLTGPKATRPALLAAIRQRPAWASIHVACHAVVDAAKPRRSALALAPSANDDGRLTVDDVFQLEIPADLVVLSACESGLGAVRGGEGIVGFTRAFLFSGARRTIVSLWMVDDEATSALMRRFYAIWTSTRDGKRVPTATALREAQAWIRGHGKWKHPYYWAGFVLWGLAD